MHFTFTAPLQHFDDRGKFRTFVVVPDGPASDIKEVAGRPNNGWGSVRVEVTIGSTDFQTSLFPDESGAYRLPIKRAVRDAENIEVDDRIEVAITLLDY
jgi:hypothetical protein